MADLKTELTDDPLARGYAGMTDSQAADDLNTSYRSRDRTTMTASEVVNAVDTADFLALSAAKQNKFWQLMGIGELNPFGVEATLMIDIFGGGSTTITTLAALRVESITRAQELGLRTPVRSTIVRSART